MLNNILTMAKPDPDSLPVRARIDGTTPIAETLGQVRTVMGELTAALVEILDQRCTYAIGAVVFKQNLDEVQAPDQQARNIDNALELARQLRPDSPAFHALVRVVMEAVVFASVAMQMDAFEQTIPIEH